MARRMSESSFADLARTTMRARDASLRVFPIETSSRSKVPPVMRMVSNTFAKMSESMMCPLSTTVSWAAIGTLLCLNVITQTKIAAGSLGFGGVALSARLRGFHQLAQDARGIGARRKAKGQ